MKISFCILLFFSFLIVTMAQQSEQIKKVKKFAISVEAGAINITSWNFDELIIDGSFRGALGNNDYRNYQLFSGILLRYKLGNWGIRAGFNYSKYLSQSAPGYICHECFSNMKTAIFKVKAGTQYSPIKNKEWLYGFIDLYYRNLNLAGTFGHLSSWNSLNFTRDGNVAGLNFGAGFNLRLWKGLYFNPEVFLDLRNERVKIIQTPSSTGISWEAYRTNLYYYQPCLRILFTYQF